MRARILPLTVAGILTLTTGVALAETNPPDPEVVLSPVDDTTTTTAPAETTTTTTVVVDEPDDVPQTEAVEPEPEDEVLEDEVLEDGAPEGEAPEAHPENHGLYVSQAAHDHEGEGHHGAAVSEVARTDVGKHHGEGEPEEE